MGIYLFRKHGGKVVFFGRFVAVLRAWAAFLAGVNRMPWGRFLVFNALGGSVWATLYGLGGYFLGEQIHRLTGLSELLRLYLQCFSSSSLQSLYGAMNGNWKIGRRRNFQGLLRHTQSNIALYGSSCYNSCMIAQLSTRMSTNQ